MHSDHVQGHSHHTRKHHISTKELEAKLGIHDIRNYVLLQPTTLPLDMPSCLEPTSTASEPTDETDATTNNSAGRAEGHTG